jgi:hypothetical protein
MPKKARELSALAVSRLKAEGRYAVVLTDYICGSPGAHACMGPLRCDGHPNKQGR